MRNKGKLCACGKPARVKGLCVVHYNVKYHKDASKRWLERNREKMRKWHREYQRNNGIKSIKYMHKKRFGGLREQVIQRDGEECVECGMTREEHKNEWGRDITVDHHDGAGRYSDEPNHDLANMQTLCLRCHGRKDVQRAPHMMKAR